MTSFLPSFLVSPFAPLFLVSSRHLAISLTVADSNWRRIESFTKGPLHHVLHSILSRLAPAGQILVSLNSWLVVWRQHHRAEISILKIRQVFKLKLKGSRFSKTLQTWTHFSALDTFYRIFSSTCLWFFDQFFAPAILQQQKQFCIALVQVSFLHFGTPCELRATWSNDNVVGRIFVRQLSADMSADNDKSKPADNDKSRIL
jgi:hypothetical protein